LLEDFLHQPEGGLYITLLLRIQKFVFHRADKVITPSSYLKGILQKYYKVPAVKIEVVYNAVELKEVEAAGEKYGQPVVITIGRLVPWKGIGELIELVPALVEKYPDFKLLVVGDGPENDKLKKLCHEIGAEPHVIFTGKVSHEQTLSFLKNSDIFVLNSRYEGLPHTVIEAMACQCPVVATNIGGTREVVDDRKTGMTVNPEDKIQLIENIGLLLNNNELRQKIIDAAYRAIKDRFTWERTLAVLEESFKGVLET